MSHASNSVLAGLTLTNGKVTRNTPVLDTKNAPSMRPTEDMVERFAKDRFEARSGLCLRAGSFGSARAVVAEVGSKEKKGLNGNAR